MKNGLPPIHPGEILREEVLKPMGLSANALARELRVPVTRISEILHGRRGISAETALRLSHFLGTTPEFWLNLQAAYDLRVVARKSGSRIAREVHPRAA
ncbi:MAG: addiction module antidote protein, HigA family [Candidatus Muproteobacteria bacterium RIFCSPHIGHO2_01_FULL_65_16]|uniref:Addiction module antidote protein, HigA family n=2 Tax=Candidatus Muproteobacteria TaxID=1817795 RepID=A0A1F6TPG6_9PROT|nr:MAG: addiction module antidote protein, HigA family [Candidatus Muproteobacteria bacterium RIFCSPHIGHO2_01_FULL_65_16]OGI51739.1 MAG: addiction module antidote protein, HigA family [Candidatus Muproteobacteria bacterium RIFCSPHIGHO2_02_FULL_65_16]